MIKSGTRDRDNLLNGHGVRIAKDHLFIGFCHHDGIFAVRREVQVIGVMNINRFSRQTSLWVDRCQIVTCIVIHPKSLEIPGGNHMLWTFRNFKSADYFESLRVDLGNSVAGVVWHINALWKIRNNRTQIIGSISCVNILGVCYGRHSG